MFRKTVTEFFENYRNKQRARARAHAHTRQSLAHHVMSENCASHGFLLLNQSLEREEGEYEIEILRKRNFEAGVC